MKSKGKTIIIYNYIQYNKIFFDLFNAYIINQQKSMLIHRQLNLGSGYFFL